MSVLFATVVAGCGAAPDDATGEVEDGEIGTAQQRVLLENGVEFSNATGKSASVSSAGSVDLDGAFFQTLGTNGRSCQTCHLQSDGWTVSAASARKAFDDTGGTHALFDFDGQNCVGADRSTVAAREAASSLMINKALVRFNRQVVGEVEVIAAEGTYCNVTDSTNIVVYRRPLPTTNFQTLGTVLWDGLGNAIGPPLVAIGAITVGATLLHAETSVFPTNEQIGDIMGVMTSLATAQTFDNQAKELDDRHALGGPENLAAMTFTGPAGFHLYDSWTDVPGGGTEAARRSVARGQEIFNTRPINVTGVGGVSDFTGTCSSCHSSPNMGNTSGFRVMDLGLSDASRRTPDLPLYTLRNVNTGETRQSSDPGAAMVTGLWADVNKFKVPNLRALASRAPYFHNGRAATLENVVGFYNGRFAMGMTATEREDLRNFLASL